MDDVDDDDFLDDDDDDVDDEDDHWLIQMTCPCPAAAGLLEGSCEAPRSSSSSAKIHCPRVQDVATVITRVPWSTQEQAEKLPFFPILSLWKSCSFALLTVFALPVPAEKKFSVINEP